MNEWFTSPLSGKKYDLKKTARVPDRRLQILYIQHGIQPLDQYVSLDDNGHKIIVMLFDKKATAPYFEQWRNNKPQRR